MLFRGEDRHFRAASSSLFRSMGLPVDDDSHPFETLAAHERQTIDHHLGLIKEWVGDPKGAKRFYEHEGSPSLPDAILTFAKAAKKMALAIQTSSGITSKNP